MSKVSERVRRASERAQAGALGRLLLASDQDNSRESNVDLSDVIESDYEGWTTEEAEGWTTVHEDDETVSALDRVAVQAEQGTKSQIVVRTTKGGSENLEATWESFEKDCFGLGWTLGSTLKDAQVRRIQKAIRAKALKHTFPAKVPVSEWAGCDLQGCVKLAPHWHYPAFQIVQASGSIRRLSTVTPFANESGWPEFQTAPTPGGVEIPHYVFLRVHPVTVGDSLAYPEEFDFSGWVERSNRNGTFGLILDFRIGPEHWSDRDRPIFGFGPDGTHSLYRYAKLGPADNILSVRTRLVSTLRRLWAASSDDRQAEQAEVPSLPDDGDDF